MLSMKLLLYATVKALGTNEKSLKGFSSCSKKFWKQPRIVHLKKLSFKKMSESLLITENNKQISKNVINSRNYQEDF